MVIRSVHRLSRILLTCPAQVHFRLLTCSLTSMTLVFYLTQMFVFISRYVMFNILLFIFVCATTSLFFAWVVSAHVSAPYVIAGNMHTSCRFVSSNMFQCYHCEYVAVLGECCHRAVGVDFLQEFDVHIFYPLFLKRGQYCLSLH